MENAVTVVLELAAMKAAASCRSSGPNEYMLLVCVCGPILFESERNGRFQECSFFILLRDMWWRVLLAACGALAALDMLCCAVVVAVLLFV